jgi:hypothetical protein
MSLNVEYFERQGYERIANGCFGVVYSHRNTEWVIKRGQSDGTRSFLEWCLHRTRQGRRMKGMPDIDWMIPDGDGFYLVAMRKYESIKDNLQKYGWETGNKYFNLHTCPGCPQYIQVLIQVFQDETGIIANDMHYQNIMFDSLYRKELIVIDPSSGKYKSSASAKIVDAWLGTFEEPEFELVG